MGEDGYLASFFLYLITIMFPKGFTHRLQQKSRKLWVDFLDFCIRIIPMSNLIKKLALPAAIGP
jgi:hypothetical protein